MNRYKVMLNAYPDSIGGQLSCAAKMLNNKDFEDVFSLFYILPSMFNSDLDRGFSLINYELNEELVTQEDLSIIKTLGIELKLDFVLNHLSVQSMQFKDILINGQKSIYKDFFINWNEFWDNNGSMTPSGYIQPNEDLIKDMFFRKPGLPIMMVPMPNGEKLPYWNTFYQEIDESKNVLLGQMDLNLNSTMVWEFYEDVFQKLSNYGASIVRLDAFAYAHKQVGAKNFLNEPGTWDILDKVQQIADKYKIELLPEIHASYEERIYEKLTQKGYMVYDFFLPGLLIDAVESKNCDHLVEWGNEVIEKNIRTVNMLGCHDGIPLLDLKGLVPESQIKTLIKTIVSRGGFVKELHGQENIYYQVNSTYYSALGENDEKLLLCRAIQIFMPGIPQVWYLDLFAGINDLDAVKRAGEGGHKEINRTNLTMDKIEEKLKTRVVQEQLELLRFRNSNPAFNEDSKISILKGGDLLTITWENNGNIAKLEASFLDYSYKITSRNNK